MWRVWEEQWQDVINQWAKPHELHAPDVVGKISTLLALD